jgi:ribonuclease T1
MGNVTAKPVKTLLPLLVALCAVLGLTTPAFAARAQAPCGDTSGFEEVALSGLPPEAEETADLIETGGPFPYPEDGTVFQNREGLLPDCETGYYHEYTVETPGSDDRGARRIVTGTGGEHFYTGDHYASFDLIDLAAAPAPWSRSRN